MLYLALEQNRHGLVHLVADDTTFDRALRLLSRIVRLFAHHRPPLLDRARRFFAEQHLDLRDLALDAFEMVRLLLLPGTFLQAQVELLAAQLDELLLQVLRGLGTKFFEFHHNTVRFTNWVCTDSLAAARRNASRAVGSSTPSISYNIRPGATTATQNSTLPLPLPMRTSIGFLLIG